MVGRAATRILRVTAGTILLLVGLAGLVLPALPGTPFVLVGLGILGSENERAHRASQWLRGLLRRGRPVEDERAPVDAG